MSKTAKLSKIPRYSNVENQNLCKLLMANLFNYYKSLGIGNIVVLFITSDILEWN